MPPKRDKAADAAPLSLRKKRIISLTHAAIYAETGETYETVVSLVQRENAKEARYLFCVVAFAKGLSNKEVATALSRERTVVYDYVRIGNRLQITDASFARKAARCLAYIKDGGTSSIKDNAEDIIQKIKASLATTQEMLEALERLLRE